MKQGPNYRTKFIIFCISTGMFLIGFVLNITIDNPLYNANLNIVPTWQDKLGSSGFITFMNIISNIFNPVICAGYIAIFWLISYRKLEILVFLVWFIFLSFLLSILKQVFSQARPYWQQGSGIQMLEWTCYTEYGLPSGHSMLGLVLMQFIVRFFARVHKNISNNLVWFYILIFILQILVMFSRIILGMHTFNQVLMGAMIGIYSFVPYYFYVQAFISRYFVTLISSHKFKTHLLIIISAILICLLIQLLITFIPTYSMDDTYWAVILGTAGCQNSKLYKSFQYKCFQDSSIIMVALGMLLSLMFMKKPDNLSKQLNYSRGSLKFILKLVIMIVHAAVPAAIFLNPGWGKIDIDVSGLASIIWICQNIGFFLVSIALLIVSPIVNQKLGCQVYENAESFKKFIQYQTFPLYLSQESLQGSKYLEIALSETTRKSGLCY